MQTTASTDEEDDKSKEHLEDRSLKGYMDSWIQVRLEEDKGGSTELEVTRL